MQLFVLKIASVSGVPSALTLAFRLGWSFWLMTPSFFLTIFAAMVGAAILGCKCSYKFDKTRQVVDKTSAYPQDTYGNSYSDQKDGRTVKTTSSRVVQIEAYESRF